MAKVIQHLATAPATGYTVFAPGYHFLRPEWTKRAEWGFNCLVNARQRWRLRRKLAT